MWPSLKPSQRIALGAAISPQSANAAVSTAWVDASQFGRLLGVVSVGVISATGLVDASLQQAQDNAGTGAKALATPIAMAQMSQAGGGSNTQAFLQVGAGLLDTVNGFKFVKLVITPSVAAALISGELFGLDPHYAPADGHDNASLAQIVG